jgi:hypothetical protein
MSPDKEIQRGRHAEQLLNDELLKEAFDTVEDAILEKWRQSPVRDLDGQHELRLLLKAVMDVKGYIVEVMNTGKLAAISAEKPSKVSIMQQKFYGS